MKKISNPFIVALLMTLLVFCSGVDATNSTYQPELSPMPMKPAMTEIWQSEVATIFPGENTGDATSDAIILFNGSNLDHWVSQKSPTQVAPWTIVDNKVLQVKPGAGSIQTKMKYTDIQLHIEFSAPIQIRGTGQGRRNSGIFLQNRYELQILGSYQNRSYRNGQAGSIYKDHAPLVNVMKSSGQWNSYDIIYTAPRFKSNGNLDYPARMTVLHNGVLIQNNVTINGLTKYVGLHSDSKTHGADVISLQEHGNKVQFRNIWVREL